MTVNPCTEMGAATSYVPAPRLRTAAGSRMEVVLSDIDSTLADTRQRRFACPTVDPLRTWTEYAMLCGSDDPIWATIRVLKMFHAAGYGIHLITGRPERTRKLTVSWLLRFDVPYDELRMRPDSVPIETSLKVAYVQTLRAQGFEPVLFLEDWPAEAAAIEKETGVPVLCLNPRYGEDV